jgi:hypothetical protein
MLAPLSPFSRSLRQRSDATSRHDRGGCDGRRCWHTAELMGGHGRKASSTAPVAVIDSHGMESDAGERLLKGRSGGRRKANGFHAGVADEQLIG